MTIGILRKFALPALAALALVLTHNTARADDTLRVGDGSPTAYSFVPPAIGTKYGIFPKYGITIQQTGFGGSAKLHQAMAAGAIDIGLGAGSDFPFLIKGSPEVAVAAMAGPPLLFGFTVPYDSPIHAMADLKGKKIGISTRGSSTEWLVLQLLKKEGWNRSDVTMVEVGSDTAGQTAALVTHQVDAVVSATALGFQLAEQKRGRLLFPASDVATDFLTHVIYASNKIVHDKPDAVRNFLKGWFETIAFMKSHPAETIAMTRQRTGYDEAVEEQEYKIVTPMFLDNGHFPPAALKAIDDSFVDLKILDTEPDLSKYIDEEFLPK